MQKLNDTPIFWFFLSLIFWAPLPLGSNREWSQMLLCIIIALLSISWFYLFIKEKISFTNVLYKSRYAFFLLFCSIIFLAYQYKFNSIDAESTLIELIFSIALILYFGLSLVLINSTKRIELTIYCIVISGVFQSSLGALMTLSEIEYSFFFIPKESHVGVATGTFANRNHLANYLTICSAFGIGILISKLKTHSHENFKSFFLSIINTIINNKIILRLAIVLMVTGIVLTHSRMGNSAFFISLTVTIVLMLLLSKRSFKSIIIFFISMLIIDIAIIGTFFGVDKVIHRLETTSINRESRDEVDIYSISIIKDNIMTGTGAGTFYTAFPQVRKENLGFLFYDHAHNDYLEFLVERGLIGILPLVILVISTCAIALKALRKRKKKLLKGCAFASLMSIIAMAIHSTVEFNLQIPANSMLFVLSLALGWISLYFERGNSSKYLANSSNSGHKKSG